MDVDSNFPIDLEGINRIVDTADVFVVGFTLFPERLLVDARYNTAEGPLVQVVPPVSSVEERYRHLRELRPRFQLPDKFMFFVWPKPIASFERLGIWQRIVERSLASGHQGVLERCQEAMRDLRRREREATIAALRGDGYQNLWTHPDRA